ncbi:HdeD family acid-resistance protein [Halogeometricum luteum]|uniref:DUF308 domain-containing protein n=1 Tax=Halogeometricum luteum TaxID=2950537 RepID=A0ABU2G3A8_9EURY|nr:DUF308 domain-containing protein [Halogeometricum sp. S3BR5-2]MDS0295263.1 DUF308 domain-containing protein [Halogeometricum sp. S3BR5-2]
MSTDTQGEPEMVAESEASLERLLRDEGRTLMIVGGLLAVLGIGAILFPVLSSLTVGLFFGAALAVAGFAHIAHAFSAPGWKGALGEIFLAVVFLIAGLAMLVNPVLTLTTLTLLVISYFVLEGLALLYFAWTLRNERGWVWSVAAGVVSLVLAGLLFAGFPATAAWALGLLVGVNLLTTGVSMMVVGNGIRKGADATGPSMAHPDTGV